MTFTLTLCVFCYSEWRELKRFYTTYIKCYYKLLGETIFKLRTFIRFRCCWNSAQLHIFLMNCDREKISDDHFQLRESERERETYVPSGKIKNFLKNIFQFKYFSVISL